MKLYNHKSRYNNPRDIQIYTLLKQGGDSSSKEISQINPYKNRDNILISSGGGSFCQSSTYDLIKKKFLSIWLDVDEDTIFKRVKRNQNKRPLIRGLDEIELRDAINNLMFKRRNCYNKADIRIQLHDLKMDKSFNKIYSKIKMHFTK